ncbi:MAG: YjgN family protein [Smithellaceae bacterium]
MENAITQEGSDTHQPDFKKYLFSFEGQGGTLFGIQIVNLLLIIVTLGIYYFWAKTRVRQYIWSQIAFHGDRLAYHGTGKEIFLGFLKALLIFGVPIGILQNLPQLLALPVIVHIIGFMAGLILIGLFIPVATVGTRRYRLSRTSLRGIRFSFRGRWRQFAWLLYSRIFLVIISFGFYRPYYEMQRQAFMAKYSFLGNQNFEFDGRGSDLIGQYVLAFFLALPTLGLMLIWYHCKKTVYVWGHTSFAGARFASSITFGGLLKLYLVNALIIVFTLGIGLPWVRVRTMRYYLSNLMLEGKLDMDAITQEAAQAGAWGEQLGDFLSIDFDL